MEHLGIQTIRLGSRSIESLYLTNDEIYIADINTMYPRIFNIISTMHTHNFYYLVWIENGGFKYYVDLKEYDVPNNSILMLSPGEMHRFRVYRGYRVSQYISQRAFFRNLDIDLANYIKNDIMKGVPMLHIYDMRSADKIKGLMLDIEDLCKKSKFRNNII